MAYSAGMSQDAKSSAGPLVHINHVAHYVADLDACTKFYKEIIGLQPIAEPFKVGRHSWFSMGGNSQLHLIKGRTTEAVPAKNTHLCFSTNDFDQFLKTLETKNIAYENAEGKKSSFTNRPDGIKQIWLQDPDGYWIEINSDY
jgi:lactoylglutathione lyase